MSRISGLVLQGVTIVALSCLGAQAGRAADFIYNEAQYIAGLDPSGYGACRNRPSKLNEYFVDAMLGGQRLSSLETYICATGGSFGIKYNAQSRYYSETMTVAFASGDRMIATWCKIEEGVEIDGRRVVVRSPNELEVTLAGILERSRPAPAEVPGGGVDLEAALAQSMVALAQRARNDEQDSTQNTSAAARDCPGGSAQVPAAMRDTVVFLKSTEHAVGRVSDIERHACAAGGYVEPFQTGLAIVGPPSEFSNTQLRLAMLLAACRPVSGASAILCNEATRVKSRDIREPLGGTAVRDLALSRRDPEVVDRVAAFVRGLAPVETAVATVETAPLPDLPLSTRAVLTDRIEALSSAYPGRASACAKVVTGVPEQARSIKVSLHARERFFGTIEDIARYACLTGGSVAVEGDPPLIRLRHREGYSIVLWDCRSEQAQGVPVMFCLLLGVPGLEEPEYVGPWMPESYISSFGHPLGTDDFLDLWEDRPLVFGTRSDRYQTGMMKDTISTLASHITRRRHDGSDAAPAALATTPEILNSFIRRRESAIDEVRGINWECAPRMAPRAQDGIPVRRCLIFATRGIDTTGGAVFNQFEFVISDVARLLNYGTSQMAQLEALKQGERMVAYRVEAAIDPAVGNSYFLDEAPLTDEASIVAWLEQIGPK